MTEVVSTAHRICLLRRDMGQMSSTQYISCDDLFWLLGLDHDIVTESLHIP